MSEYKGYWVTSFHLLPHEGLKQPFEAEIIGDVGNYWMVKVGRKKVQVLKAACSTVPYKPKEVGSEEYRKKVEEATGKSLAPPDPKKQPDLTKPKAKPQAKQAKPGSKAKPKNNDPFSGLLDF